MQPGNSNRYPVMFSQGKAKYDLPENAGNLPNVDNDHQQRDVLSNGHNYGPQGKTHFEDHTMQPGNSNRYPVMFDQKKDAEKAKSKEQEEDSGDEADSGSDTDEETAPGGKNAATPTNEKRDNDDQTTTPVLTRHMSKGERDAYYNTDELKGFAQEEDRSIKEQLDG